MGVALSLAGKRALITGGSRGIGAETVRLFREAGARVAFNYRAAREQAEALAAACGGPDLCVAIEQELGSAEDGRGLVQKAVAALGGLDILVANHGVWPAEDVGIDSMSEAQWQQTLGVNLDAVFGLVQAAAREFLKRSSGAEQAGSWDKGPSGAKAREVSGEFYGTAEAVPLQNRSAGGAHEAVFVRDSGEKAAGAATGREAGGTTGLERGAAMIGGVKHHIVLISSTAGQRGEAYHADYAVTKGALISLTKSLSTELAPKGIMVNCVAPGWVATDMSAATLADPVRGEKIGAGIPVGRVATPREIAGPVLFLCTPLAGFISGEILNVNGGAVLVG